MYTRCRFDALTDGVFSVSMTLLVMDVRLPDALAPGDATAFVPVLRDLKPKWLAQAMSLFVVGVTWLAKVVARKRSQTIGRGEALRPRQDLPAHHVAAIFCSRRGSPALRRSDRNKGPTF